MTTRVEAVDEAVVEDAPPEDARTTSLATALLGALMVLGGVLAVVDATTLRSGGGDDPLGPALAPGLIGALLVLLGAALVVRTLPGLRAGTDAAGGLPRPGRRGLGVLAVLVLLLAFALVLTTVGWVVSAAGLYTGAALLLGAPRDGRVAAQGFVVASVAFLVFDRLIGLTLPSGPWGF